MSWTEFIAGLQLSWTIAENSYSKKLRLKYRKKKEEKGVRKNEENKKGYGGHLVFQNQTKYIEKQA